MQYLRQVRLDRVHDNLAQGTNTVAEAASYWGFTNPSRFARAYRDRFGEFPAATSDAARGRAPTGATRSTYGAARALRGPG